MRALHVPAAGEQPQLSDIPTPEPTEGTVLVRVKAAGLNPIDNAVAAGFLTQMGLPHEYPVIIGRDAAGVVEAVGAGVDHVAVGDEVLGHVLLAPPISAGTLAEYALLPAVAVTPKPAGLDGRGQQDVAEDLVADGDVVDAGADGLHDAGGVAAEHEGVLVRQAHLGEHAGGDGVVDGVEAGGLDPDDHGAFRSVRGGDLAELGLFSGGGNVQCAHDDVPFRNGRVWLVDGWVSW